MAGRPHGRMEIVPINEIIPIQARNERWNMASLIPAIPDADACLQWLAKRRLLRNTFLCDNCGNLCTIHMHARSIDGRRWSCRRCNVRKSIRDGSFFAGSHLTLKQIIIMMYCWSYDMPQDVMKHEAEVTTNHTVVDWCNFMREECAVWLENNPDEVGGFDNNGESLVVEIDESKYFHRKYHRGQWHDGHWVFGGIERGSGKCFLVEVANRTAATLEPLIQRYILPGTHIMSDGWPSYANIERIDNGIYIHDVVVHQRHFVDPDDRNIHTENVENMWMRAKRKLRRQFGTSRALFTSYLHEFVFRNRFRNEDMFQTLLHIVSENYPL